MRPRIIRKKGYLDFRDSENRNRGLIRIQKETLENLETAYNEIQGAYEDRETITKGVYLHWTSILWKKGLEIDEADKNAIKNMPKKYRTEAA